MSAGVAVGLAVLAALGYGVASVLEAEGARRVGGVQALATAWTAGGLVLDALAWGASLVALRVLPVVVVQALLAGSLVVTAVLARWTTGAAMRRVDVVAVAGAVLALTVLAGAGTEQSSPRATGGVVVGALVASGVLAVVAAAWYRTAPAGALAVVGGLGFSVTAFAARAAHGASTAGADGGVLRAALSVVVQPLTLALVVGGVVGLVCFLRALERGSVGPVTAVLWTVEVLVPGAAGLLVLGDRLRPGWDAPALVAVVVAVAACATLAYAPAATDAPGAAGPVTAPSA